MLSVNLPTVTFLLIIISQLVNYLVYRFYSAKTDADAKKKNAIMLGLFLGGLGITMCVMIYIIFFKLNKIDEIARNLESLQ